MPPDAERPPDAPLGLARPPSRMRRLAGRGGAVGAALVAACGAGGALGGGALAWAALGVSGYSAWKDGAFVAGPQIVLCVAAAVIAGALAAVLAQRFFVGPPLELVEWTLAFGGLPSLRDADAPPAPGVQPGWMVAHLLEPLERLGYSLEVSLTDELGRPLGPASRSHPLGGASLQLRERSPAGLRGHVLVRVPPPRGGGVSLGFVDARGALDGLYEELSRYAIAALGLLDGDLVYKRIDSGLDEEPATALWNELPDRPAGLGNSPHIPPTETRKSGNPT